MLRRSFSLCMFGLVAIVAACDNLTGGTAKNGTPVGIVLMNSRTKGAGYTTYPKVNFYNLASATFAFSNVNTDSCVAGAYDSTAANGTTTAPQVGAGTFMLSTVSGRTDSLYKATTGDQTYHPTPLSGISYNPGDSITFQIAGDFAGFPQLTTAAATAEPFVIVRPTIPTAGNPMLISWTPAVRSGEAMYVALLYNQGGGTALNRQLFCNFADDGQGAVQASLISELTSSIVPFVMKAQRVQTALRTPSSTLAYLNIISTFEVPTPVSP